MTMKRERIPSPEETRKKKKQGRNFILTALMIVAAAVLIFSVVMILIQTVFLPGKNKNVINDYRDMLSSALMQNNSTPQSSSSSTESSQPIDDRVLEQFRGLLAANPDFAGWLTIPGTDLDHPVFYTPEDQNYYIKRNAKGEDDKYGSLFLSAGSTLLPQAQKMVMYGHNMEDDDLMFGQLTKYTKLKFMKQTPVFSFDTIYRTGEWKILGICYASTNFAGNGFDYSTSSFATEEEFQQFIWKVRTRSFYQIEDDVRFDDSLLVLSTCEYSFWGERLIVVARRLREGESADTVSSEKIQNNAYYLLPEEYYANYSNKVKPTAGQIADNYRAYYGKDAFFSCANP